MKRLLALLIVLALAVPRFFASAQTVAPSAHVEAYMHDIYVDPLVYTNSTGNVYIVEFKSLAAKDLFVQMLAKKAIELPPNVKFLHAYKYLPFVILGGDPEGVVEFAKTVPGTVAVRHNEKYYLERNPNVDYAPTSLSNVLRLGAQTFREHGYTGMGIVIAIIDTGIYKEHQEFNYDNGTCKVIYEESFVLTIYGYDRNETNPDDGVGHGTMVAGAAAGLGKQPDGQGVAPDAALVNLKVFPSGQDTYATSAGIIAAIDRAIELKVSGQVDIDIINMSLGGSPDIHYDPEIAAVNAAIEHGIAVVIAAGNEGDNGRASGYVSSPGIAPEAITAGAAYGRNETIEGYSSPGPTPRLGVKPDVVAPGTGTYPVPPFVSEYGYRQAAGTSFASPHTAGSVALILQYILKNSNVTGPEAIGFAKAVLMESAVHIVKDVDTNTAFGELRIGAGFINLTNAYYILESNPTPGFVYVLPTHLPVSMVMNATANYPITGPLFPRSNGVYVGQKITVNFTLTSGVPYHVTVVVSGDLANAIEVLSDTSIEMQPPTTTYAFKFRVKDVSAGVYTGTIDFVATNGTVLFSVKVELNVLGAPAMRLLRDLHHTDRGYDTPYGQFSLFARALAEHGVAIDILTPDEPFNASNLYAYDRIFTGDFASGVTLTIEDAKTFIDYIAHGGHTIILVMDPVYYDIDAIGRLAYAFGIGFTETTVSGGQGSPVLATRNSSLPMGLSGKMPMYGLVLDVMNPGVLELATYNKFVVAAMAVTPTGGALTVFGTNFLFDNRAMTDQYGVAATEIIGAVRALMSFNYVSAISGMFLNVTGDFTLNGQVSVNTNIPAMKIVHSDRVEGEEVSDSFTIKRAGPNALGVSFSCCYAPFGVVLPLRIEPSEFDAPQMQVIEANITITPDKELKIPIRITDITGVEPAKLEITVSVLKATGPMTVKPARIETSGTPTDLTVYIVFTPDQFTIIFGAANTVEMVVVVKSFDLNYNYETDSEKVTASINKAPELSVKYETAPEELKLYVTINDDDAKNTLIVYVDGEVKYNATVDTGKEIAIDFSLPAGDHNITVVAIDPVGNKATRSETISVPQKTTSKTLYIAIAAIAIVVILALVYLLVLRKPKA